MGQLQSQNLLYCENKNVLFGLRLRLGLGIMVSRLYDFVAVELITTAELLPEQDSWQKTLTCTDWAHCFELKMKCCSHGMACFED
jgi:phage-related baseplate assembly protein